MLQDTDLGCVSVKRQAVASRKANKSTETKSWRRKTRGTQTRMRSKSSSTQTEVRASEGKLLASISAGDEELTEFVRRVGPTILQELVNNSGSHAFDDYRVVWEDERGQIRKLQTLSRGELKAASQARPCSAVAWNCTGNLIAGGYAERDHIGWCDHISSIACWNIMSRRLDEQKPEVELEVSCCVTSLAFHPARPMVLAAGLFNGEIRLYDIGGEAEDPLLASSKIDDYFHREPIAELCWHRELRGGYRLASVSGDGKVLFWSTANRLAHPLAGASLVPTAQYHGHGSRRNPHPVLGGTSIAFSSLDFTHYVVGTEGGGILKCARPRPPQGKQNRRVGKFTWSPSAFHHLQGLPQQSRYELKRSMEKHAVKHGVKVIDLPTLFEARPDPTKVFPQAARQCFDRHSGPVYAISASPFHRNLFLTCSTDGTLRLYNMLKVPRPIMLMEPTESYLFDVKWSPSRPLVLAAADGEGRIHIYDLGVNTVTPLLSFRASRTNSPIVSINFSSKDGSLLAAADDNGEIIVWQLSSRLSTVQEGELQILERLGTVEEKPRPQQSNRDKKAESSGGDAKQAPGRAERVV